MSTNAIAAYATLRRKVKETLILGQERIERQKVRTYWETGRLIHSHTLHHQDHAEYGREVILRLAHDLEVGDELLYRTLHVYRAFPISSHGRKLAWSHLRVLMRIPDARTRFELARRAEKHGWNVPELERVVRKFREKSRAPAGPRSGGGRAKLELLEPKKGTPYLYQIRAPQPLQGEAELKIDLGFRVRKKLSLFKTPRGLKPGDRVESKKIGEGYKIVKAGGKTAQDLFTYYAQVLRVVDGDTLYVEVDLGFGDSIEEYLRLRGIDCPEIDTARGREAKAFVQKELGPVPLILLRSSQTDQWDRYVADVFYTRSGTERFLNNRLLEAGLAERADE